MFQLRVKPDEGHPFATAVGKDVFLIGRGEACDLILPDLLVSREHARLMLGPDGPLLEDLNSINGTFVNGRRIGRIRLRDGDVIRLGGIEITLEPLLEQTVVQSPSPPPRP